LISDGEASPQPPKSAAESPSLEAGAFFFHAVCARGADGRTNSPISFGIGPSPGTRSGTPAALGQHPKPKNAIIPLQPLFGRGTVLKAPKGVHHG
jgi:hypothetical protein